MRPGGTTPLPVSTTSTELLCLSVGAHVHHGRSDTEVECMATTVRILHLVHDIYIYYFRLYLLLIYHYTLSVPSYSNMEVLASMNRMSAITFLSFYFSSKNGTGLHF